MFISTTRSIRLHTRNEKLSNRINAFCLTYETIVKKSVKNNTNFIYCISIKD